MRKKVMIKKTFIIHNIIIIIIIIVDDEYDEQGTCVFIVHILFTLVYIIFTINSVTVLSYGINIEGLLDCLLFIHSL